MLISRHFSCSPHYKVAAEKDRIRSDYGVALARQSEAVIEDLSGRIWVQSAAANHYANTSAPLFGRLRASAFGHLISGFEHLSPDGVHPAHAASEVVSQEPLQ